MTPESPARPASLSALGITADIERAYRDLLSGERRLTPGEEEQLVNRHLARFDADRCVPVSIDLLWTTWQARRAQDRVEAQAAVGAFLPLYEDFLARDDSRSFVEVLRGPDALERRMRELWANTRVSIDELIRPPFYSGPTATMPDQQASLPPEVLVRGIYESSLLPKPGVLDAIRQSIDLGEQARVCATVPLRLRIFDSTWAVMTLPEPATDPEGMRTASLDGLLITKSPFLDALMRLFETFWVQSTPIMFDGGGDDDTTRRLLSYMEAGLTDAAIGAAMGVSERTVHRRISALMEQHGVSTRFQLGMAAERRR